MLSCFPQLVLYCLLLLSIFRFCCSVDVIVFATVLLLSMLPISCCCCYLAIYCLNRLILSSSCCNPLIAATRVIIICCQWQNLFVKLRGFRRREAQSTLPPDKTNKATQTHDPALPSNKYASRGKKHLKMDLYVRQKFC